jgi:hypothetical protein
VDDWAARHLDSFCPPGQHRFIGIAIGPNEQSVLHCTQCDKEERRDRANCLVCSNEGVQGAALVDPSGGHRVPGALCELCSEDFRSSGTILGWRAEFCDGQAKTGS